MISLLDSILPCYGNGKKIIDWDVIENKICISFPEDYKSFIEIYGGVWIDEFIFVLDPLSNVDRLNIDPDKNKLLESYVIKKESFPNCFRHEVYKDGFGIFPWAVTSNADTIYWEFKNKIPQSVVLYDARSGDYLKYCCTMSEFLYKILTKKINCDIFPEDFPSDGKIK